MTSEGGGSRNETLGGWVCDARRSSLALVETTKPVDELKTPAASNRSTISGARETGPSWFGRPRNSIQTTLRLAGWVRGRGRTRGLDSRVIKKAALCATIMRSEHSNPGVKLYSLSSAPDWSFIICCRSVDASSLGLAAVRRLAGWKTSLRSAS